MVLESTKTIAGSCAIDCDVVASRLAERLESLALDGPLADALQKDEFTSNSGVAPCELEIEVRLGSIKNTRDGQRFSLPIATDALLSDRAPIRFQPCVSNAQFQTAYGLLKQAAEESDTKSRWQTQLGVLTYDRFFKLPEYEESVRISVPQNQTTRTKSFEAIRKVKLLTWNVSTGSAMREAQMNDEADDVGEQDQIDYRIAVNLEYRVPMRDLPNTSAASMRRKKNRNTYIHREGNIRFDLTQVQTVESDSNISDNSNYQYEVEAELMGNVVVDVLKSQNLSHIKKLQMLKYHCTTLIGAVQHMRDVIMRGESYANTPGALHNAMMTTKLGLCDLRMVQHTEDVVAKYRKVVCPQLPLVGDYLFRAITPALERGAIKKQKVSPYREHIENIEGPFVVEDGGAERGKYVVLSKRT
ncbi:mRNA capping protein beta chain [Babesia ovis]|uniref:mRNA 5'-phosphatase n=1 Tax=Babesia ovis TaxID=5869 RepID=A0A9W5T922_BABOV|nr:mRNA capping protein beta chain [Babesia ovis]